jgi:hypothetical protein
METRVLFCRRESKQKEEGSSATSTVQDVTDVTDVREREGGRRKEEGGRRKKGNAVAVIVSAIKNVLNIKAVDCNSPI